MRVSNKGALGEAQRLLSVIKIRAPKFGWVGSEGSYSSRAATNRT